MLQVFCPFNRYLRLCIAYMENITTGAVEVHFQVKRLIFIFVVPTQ